MLSALALVFFLVGVVCLIVGYTRVAPQAVHPGWVCLVIALVLIVLAELLLPALSTSDYRDDGASAAQLR